MKLNQLFNPLVTFAAVLGVSSVAFAETPAQKTSVPATGEKTVFAASGSTLKWEGKKVTGKHNGTIKLKKGEITMKGKDLIAGDFEIDMTSIADEDVKDATYNAKLITHLKSEDFFGVDKFPVAILKIKSAKSVNGFVGPTYEVVADLTIKGKTNPVQFPVVIEKKDGKTTAKANITVDRTAYDVRYGSGKFFQNLGDKMIDDKFSLDVLLATQ